MRHRIIDVITGVRPSELVFETREKAEEWLQGYQVADAYKRDHYRIVPFDVPYIHPADQLIAEAWERNRPTGDDFAARLWQWSNNPNVPYDLAAETMRKAGYEPFAGFPLVRSKRHPQPSYVTAITDGDGITRHLSRPIRLL